MNGQKVFNIFGRVFGFAWQFGPKGDRLVYAYDAKSRPIFIPLGITYQRSSEERCLAVILGPLNFGVGW